jgi:predicted DCC family thiol-disulfide oxidoreductase YuxK
MKTLAHKVIIYDDVCPLCKAYTEGFVRLGWLPVDNRIGFSEAPASILNKIDMDRARHEIPLFDTETGETLYGKEALFYILGEEMPIFKPLFRLAFFKAIVFCLYQIITYNRRIIAGSKKPDKGFDCAPDFNAFYRWLYIGLASFMSLIVFYNNIQYIDNKYFTCILPIAAEILRGCFIKSFIGKTTYFGHLATVVFLMALLLNIVGVSLITVSIISFLGAYMLIKRQNLL